MKGEEGNSVPEIVKGRGVLGLPGTGMADGPMCSKVGSCLKYAPIMCGSDTRPKAQSWQKMRDPLLCTASVIWKEIISES